MTNRNAINAMVSCATWTAVFAVGVIISGETARLLAAVAGQVYRLLHP